MPTSKKNFRCCCFKVLDFSDYTEHYASCSRSIGGIRIQRHNLICKEVTALLKNTIGSTYNKKGYVNHITTEDMILVDGGKEERQKMLIPDITVTIDVNSNTDFRDISIINNNKSYLLDINYTQAHCLSNHSFFKNLIREVDTSRDQIDHKIIIKGIEEKIHEKEKCKIVKYEEHVNAMRFNPITLDIYGGFGPETKKLFDSKFKKFSMIHKNISKDKYDSVLKWFYMRCDIISAKFAYKMFERYKNLNHLIYK